VESLGVIAAVVYRSPRGLSRLFRQKCHAFPDAHGKPGHDGQPSRKEFRF
jgi:hypothetical protein